MDLLLCSKVQWTTHICIYIVYALCEASELFQKNVLPLLIMSSNFENVPTNYLAPLFFRFLPSGLGWGVDVRNSLSMAFLAILDQYRIFYVIFILFTKWLPTAILDVRKSLSITFLISNLEINLYLSHVNIHIWVLICLAMVTWQKVLFAMFTKSKKLGLEVDVELQLFDSLVQPIMLYGCEVWGFKKVDVLEKIHIKFCKLILIVNKSTTTAMVLGDLGIDC